MKTIILPETFLTVRDISPCYCQNLQCKDTLSGKQQLCFRDENPENPHEHSQLFSLFISQFLCFFLFTKHTLILNISLISLIFLYHTFYIIVNKHFSLPNHVFKAFRPAKVPFALVIIYIEYIIYQVIIQFNQFKLGCLLSYDKLCRFGLAFYTSPQNYVLCVCAVGRIVSSNILKFYI